MELGDKFESFESVKNKIEEFSKANFVQLFIKDARKIAAAQKSSKKELIIKEELVYRDIKYCCIKSGQYKSVAESRKTTTFKDNCPMKIKFLVSADGNHLVVNQLVLDHNHEVSEGLFRMLPQQRKLPNEIQEEVNTLLKLRPNKKLLREEIEKQTGKVTLLKDIHNIKTKFTDQNSDGSDIASVVKTLKEEHGCDCRVLSDENGLFKGLFFATKTMQETMESFPEYIGIDATYKLTDIRTPVYLIHIEDSNGCSEIVAVCLLVNEDKESVEWLIESFKEMNPSWPKIEVVMADKDWQERAVIKERIPNATVLICLFHCLRTFSREISCNKLGITISERHTSLDLLQKLVYAPHEEKFSEVYEEFSDSVPKIVKDYFDTNWLPIKEEWWQFSPGHSSSFLNSTNNRLESLNAKIKSVVEKFSNLKTFVHDFFIAINALESIRNNHLLTAIYKKSANMWPANSPEQMYEELLSPFAFKHVAKELKMSKKNYKIEATGENYEIESSCGKVKVSANRCSCRSFTSMLLPCRHLFFLRRSLAKTLFKKELCGERWTKAYYYRHHRIAIPRRNVAEPSGKVVTTNKRVLSQHEKFKKAQVLCKSLAEIISEETGDNFEERLELIGQLSKMWIDRRKVSLVIEDAIASNEDVYEVLVDNIPVSTNEFPEEFCEVVAVSSVAEIDFRLPERFCAEDAVAGTSTNNAEDFFKELQNISMPSPSRKRGRPKGSELTVIGLSKRRKTSNRLIPFIKKSSQEQKLDILRWLTTHEVSENALTQHYKVKVCDLNVSLPDSIMDENVSLNCVKRYFQPGAWLQLNGMVKEKKRKNVWNCQMCLETIGKESIACDYCLLWYDLSCTGLHKPPKGKFWMCKMCLRA